VDYLASFLCAWIALALLATGCVGPRPLKGGKAVTTGKPGGMVEQTLAQGEYPAQATKQDQESVKVWCCTLPGGSRVEQSSAFAFFEPQYERNDLLSLSLSPLKWERAGRPLHSQARRLRPTKIFGARNIAGCAGDARRFRKHTTEESS
jgi:hypothetical protein